MAILTWFCKVGVGQILRKVFKIALRSDIFEGPIYLSFMTLYSIFQLSILLLSVNLKQSNNVTQA